MNANETGTPRAWYGNGWLSANAVLVLVLIAGGALRLLTLNRESLWFDELYVVWSRNLPFRDMVPEIFASDHPPAFYLVGYLWDYLGRTEFRIRALSALLGIAVILLVYLTAKELFSRRAGLWAAAFTAVSPLLVWYSRDATSYAWVIAISLASLYLLTRSCLRGGWGNWSAYVAVTMIAVFSHVMAAVLLIAEVAYFLILRGRTKTGIKPWLASQALLFASLALMLATIRYYGNKLELADPTLLDSLNRFYTALSSAAYTLLLGYKNQPYFSPAAVPYIRWTQALLVLAVLGAVALPFISRRVRQVFVNRTTAALLAFTTVIIVGPVAVLLTRNTIAAGRYYAWAAPAIMILLAVVVAAAPRRIGVAAGGFIVAGLLMATVHDLTIDYNDDWRGMMETVSVEWQAGDMLVCFPVHHCAVAADYYLEEDIDLYGGVYKPSSSYEVYLWTPDETWRGYYNAEREFASIALGRGDIGPLLEGELEGRDRFWYVSGSGLVNNYPDVPLVEHSLRESGWRIEAEYDFRLLDLKVYERS